MNIVLKVDLSIDELFMKAKSTNKSMAHRNISIGSIFKQVKAHIK